MPACQDFKEVSEVISKVGAKIGTEMMCTADAQFPLSDPQVGFKTFLNITPTITADLHPEHYHVNAIRPDLWPKGV